MFGQDNFRFINTLLCMSAHVKNTGQISCKSCAVYKKTKIVPLASTFSETSLLSPQPLLSARFFCSTSQSCAKNSTRICCWDSRENQDRCCPKACWAWETRWMAKGDAKNLCTTLRKFCAHFKTAVRFMAVIFFWLAGLIWSCAVHAAKICGCKVSLLSTMTKRLCLQYFLMQQKRKMYTILCVCNGSFPVHTQVGTSV